MKNDILITGGHIIDPARNINEINNLRIITILSLMPINIL